MEFERELWSGICTFKSSEGRHIGENNTHPAALTERMQTENLPCKFEGSRAGLRINATALRNIMAVWTDAIGLTVLQRRNFMQHMGWQEGHLTLPQAYVLSKISTARPAYLARRSVAPLASGELDPVEAAFFSLGVGPAGIVTKLMETGDPRAIAGSRMSAAALYELADGCGSLISPFSGMGCAGSRRLIEGYLDLMINGVGEVASISDNATRVFNLVGDFGIFYEYALSACRLELYLRLSQALVGKALRTLNRKSLQLSHAQESLLALCLRDFEAAPITATRSEGQLDCYIQTCRELLATLPRQPHSAGCTADSTKFRGVILQLRVELEIFREQCQHAYSETKRALGIKEDKKFTNEQFYQRINGLHLSELFSSNDDQAFDGSTTS